MCGKQHYPLIVRLHEQINLYRDYTNNFYPDGIAKLTPEEILHLNRQLTFIMELSISFA